MTEPSSIADHMMQLFKPKPSLEIAAQELIFRWIAVWSGHTASPSDGCIIVRGDDKKQVARLSGHQIKPLVEAVINGRHALKTDLLKDRIERLEHLLGCLKACEKAVAALDPNDIMALSKNCGRRNATGGGETAVAQALAAILDTPALVQLGIGNISNEVRGALASARFELSGRRGGRGSHRNEPLYRIAEAFGVLYATVTGKTPPVSISESGPRSYSGEFSPALREVCDLLGFEGDIQRANTHAHQAVNNPIKLQSEFEALEGIRSVFERLANDDP